VGKLTKLGIMSGDLWEESPPTSAQWPRLMTGAHPRAVGTYGADVESWLADRPRLHPRISGSDGRLRWWQRLTLSRALEHDDDGALVWREVMASGPRQVGKSWLERTLCGWRIHQAEAFGRQQDVLHVAHKLQAAQEVWRPAARFFGPVGEGYRVRWANGEQMIEVPDGSRWLIQAATDGAGVAFTLSMGLVDEAWKVDHRVVDGGILPTMAEAVCPQLWLVSTAGTSTSRLMIDRRALALAQEQEPGELLLLEWSAPPDPDLDIDDPDVWRMASPHWSESRHAAVAHARATSPEVEFRQQWLNQWVPTETAPMFDPEQWQRQEWVGPLPSAGLSFGADVASDRSHACIVAHSAGVVEVVESRPGAGWVPGRLAELAATWNPVAIGLDGSGPAATVADQLRTSDISQLLVVLRARDIAAASGLCHDAIATGQLMARPHADLTESVIHARRRAFGQAWCFARQAGDVSGVPLLAVACAVWAESHQPTIIERSRIF